MPVKLRETEIKEGQSNITKTTDAMDGQNGLKLGFLKTVQPNSFSKLISAACNFKNNAQETHLFVLDL